MDYEILALKFSARAPKAGLHSAGEIHDAERHQTQPPASSGQAGKKKGSNGKKEGGKRKI